MHTDSLTIFATYRMIRVPAKRLREILSSNTISEEFINGCELALQELLTNLVEHAYENDGTKTIHVSFTLESNMLIIQTEDTGMRANINIETVEMPDPTELAEGGYGMALIKMIMDEVNYTTENDRNIWQLIKRF
jgi:serine/threonine-protein kinase RsbW